MKSATPKVLHAVAGRSLLGHVVDAAAHVRPGGMLLFTSGDAAGVAMGTYQGDPLYHASLAPDEFVGIVRYRLHPEPGQA